MYPLHKVQSECIWGGDVHLYADVLHSSKHYHKLKNDASCSRLQWLFCIIQVQTRSRHGNREKRGECGCRRCSVPGGLKNTVCEWRDLHVMQQDCYHLY